MCAKHPSSHSVHAQFSGGKSCHEESITLSALHMLKWELVSACHSKMKASKNKLFSSFPPFSFEKKKMRYLTRKWRQVFILLRVHGYGKSTV